MNQASHRVRCVLPRPNFIQGASEFDAEILQRREENIEERRRIEEGPEGMLGANEWAVFNDLEEVCLY